MKIVQACGWFFPDSLGGTETYVSALSTRLRRHGHSVFIAAPDAVTDVERSYVHDGIAVYRYPIPANPTRDEAQGRCRVRGAERLHRWLAELRPDVVHVHTFVTGLGLQEIEAAQDVGARVIVTTHAGGLGFHCQRGTMMQWGESPCDGYVTPSKCAACELQHRGLPRPVARALALVPPEVARIGRRIPGRLGTAIAMPELIQWNAARQRRVLARVDRFVVLSEWARQVLLANGAPPDRVVVNRLGVRCAAEDAARWRSTPANGAKRPVTIAYLGRFERIKGVYDLARAAGSLPHDLPLRVQFRGPVTSLQELAVVDELKRIVGPQAWVEFPDAVTPDRVFDVLRDVDVVCCPSRCLEGGPTVALEAHAAGTPVIGTRVAALTEIVSDGVNGALVDAGDWRALARVMSDLAVDPGTIARWRTALPAVRTMDDVTCDYVREYQG